MPTCSRCQSTTPRPSCPVCALPDPDMTPEREGLAASLCGRSRDANPYSQRFSNDQHTEWEEGWMSGNAQVTEEA